MALRLPDPLDMPLESGRDRLSPASEPPPRSDFAVIVPAWNEREVIPALVTELHAAFARHALEGEVILVDDGSSDGTAEVAESVAADLGWDRFRVVRHRRNQGKTEAILSGAEATSARWLVLFDADLQHLPDEIPRFLDRLEEGWDIVTGRKVGAYEKQGVSSVYNALSRALFHVPVSDLNSMKAFRRDILDEVHLRHDWHRFFVVLAHDRGYRITEIDIDLHPRRAGTSKYTGSLRVVGGVIDLLSVWFLLLFARKPLLLFGVPGLFLVGAGLLTGATALFYRFVLGTGFRPLLTLVVLLEVVGVVLLGFGLLAELVAQLRSEVEALRRSGAQTRSRTERGGARREADSP